MNEPKDVSMGFKGTAANIAPQLLPDSYYQVDQGGDRFRPGSWKRRRGMLHTDQAKLDLAVETILGFELPGEDFALAAAEGVNLHGFSNIEEQNYGTDGGSGFGETPLGEESFGE